MNTDYRLFIAAFLSGALAEQIQAVRQHHSTGSDPLTLPHVTLIRSFWRSEVITSEYESDLMAQLRRIQVKIQPFVLSFGGIGVFHSPKRVIYLNVEPTNDLLNVRHTLIEALALDDRRPFNPHLTLVKGLDQDKFKTLLARLEQSHWQTGHWSVWVEQLSLMQRGADESTWHYVQPIDLRG